MDNVVGEEQNVRLRDSPVQSRQIDRRRREGEDGGVGANEQLDGAPVEVGQWAADAQRIVFSTSPVASPEAASDEQMR